MLCFLFAESAVKPLRTSYRFNPTITEKPGATSSSSSSPKSSSSQKTELVFPHYSKSRAAYSLPLCLQQFKAHAAEYYPHMCEIILHDMKLELRAILLKFFKRTGVSFGIVRTDA
jgi:hypothetical protein